MCDYALAQLPSSEIYGDIDGSRLVRLYSPLWHEYGGAAALKLDFLNQKIGANQ